MFLTSIYLYRSWLVVSKLISMIVYGLCPFPCRSYCKCIQGLSCLRNSLLSGYNSSGGSIMLVIGIVWLPICLILTHIYTVVKDQFLQAIHRFWGQTLSHPIIMGSLRTFELHIYCHLLNPKYFLLKISPFLETMLQVSLYKSLIYFATLTHNAAEIKEIALEASMSKGRNCNRWEIAFALTSNAIREDFSLREHKSQENDWSFGVNSFDTMCWFKLLDQSTKYPIILYLLLPQRSSPILMQFQIR